MVDLLQTPPCFSSFRQLVVQLLGTNASDPPPSIPSAWLPLTNPQEIRHSVQFPPPSMQSVPPQASPPPLNDFGSFCPPPPSPRPQKIPITVHPYYQGSQLWEESMAFRFIDPTPFLPRGCEQVMVEGSKPMGRAVLGSARHHNRDLALVTIDPLPEAQVSFQSIRELLDDFLRNHKQIGFRAIQPCPHGQAYVRLNNYHDRDF